MEENETEVEDQESAPLDEDDDDDEDEEENWPDDELKGASKMHYADFWRPPSKNKQRETKEINGSSGEEAHSDQLTKGMKRDLFKKKTKHEEKQSKIKAEITKVNQYSELHELKCFQKDG